jgi:hypothetical protein
MPVLEKGEKKWCNTGNMEKLNLGWNVSLMDSWI